LAMARFQSWQQQHSIYSPSDDNQEVA
jgi:hypothetical protein